jgi:hypothetical protein
MATFIFNPATTPPFFHTFSTISTSLDAWQYQNCPEIRSGTIHPVGVVVLEKNSRTYICISSPRIGRKISFWVRCARLGRTRIVTSPTLDLRNHFFGNWMKINPSLQIMTSESGKSKSRNNMVN